MKKLLVLLLTLTMVFSLTACGGEEVEEQVLKIGLVTALSDNGDGKMQKEILDLFAKKWNENKTFGENVTVEIIAYDNLNDGAQDTEMSIKGVQKLISSDEVQIIIPGQMSSIVQATGELINSAGIVDIGLGLSATWMEQGWDYVYRTALNNNFQVPSFTTTMKSLGQESVAVLYANTDNCLTFRDSFKAAADAAGIKVLAEEMLPAQGGTGITGQITTVINSKADCIFVTVMGGSFGTVVKQIRQAGYKGMIYLGQNLNSSEAESIGDEEINGVVMCSPYVSYANIEDCKDEFIKSVLQEFVDGVGYLPISDMVYKTWDACLAIESAVKVAGSVNSADINAAMKTLKIEGCAGTMDFTTGSNECYFSARAWVYTGGAGGGPVALENWVDSDLAKKITIK